MIPVVDVSSHQGTIDFRKMRAGGVRGLIFRATHGVTVDKNVGHYVRDAKAAGYQDSDLGFYSFLNSKRGDGGPLGRFFVEAVDRALGHTDTFFMHDAESFATEPGSGPILRGSAYVDWLHEFDDAVAESAPGRTRVVYSNAAFWDPWTGRDGSFIGLDIIVARYPIYPGAATQADPVKLAAWVAQSSKPPADASKWDEWLMAITTARPRTPVAWDTWDGWQFSAGWNRQGPVYGCQSSDLDLNIVKDDAWARWTTVPQPAPAPPVEIPPVVVQPPAPTPEPEGDDDMPNYRVNEHWYGEGDGGAPGKVHFELVRDHTGRYRYLVLTDAEWDALGKPTATKIANDTLLALGPWTPPPAAPAVVYGTWGATIGEHTVSLKPSAG